MSVTGRMLDDMAKYGVAPYYERTVDRIKFSHILSCIKQKRRADLEI